RRSVAAPPDARSACRPAWAHRSRTILAISPAVASGGNIGRTKRFPPAFQVAASDGPCGSGLRGSLPRPAPLIPPACPSARPRPCPSSQPHPAPPSLLSPPPPPPPP